MKRLLKISALAAVVIITAVAVLAAVSCGSPEVEVSEFDWVRANGPTDPDKNNVSSNADLIEKITIEFDREAQDYISFTNPEVPGEGRTNPDITENLVLKITFPPNRIDALRETDITGGLREFLSFHTVKRDSPGSPISSGRADELFPAISYEFLRRERDIDPDPEKNGGDIVYVKLDISYDISSSDLKSEIVAKIDGSKLKHSNGLFVDTDGNGVAGEAGYDDRYLVIEDLKDHPINPADYTSYGATRYANIELHLPGNRNWEIELQSPNTTVLTNPFPDPVDDPDYTSKTAPAIPVNIGAFNNVSPLQNEVAAAFRSNFQLQEYNISDGSWSQVGGNSSAPNGDTILFSNVALKHLVPYRVVYKGDTTDPKVSGTFFGLQQRVTITSSTLPPDATKKYKRDLTEINGPAGIFINQNLANFATIPTPALVQPSPPLPPAAPIAPPIPLRVFAFSWDSQEKNVIVEIGVNLKDHTNNYGFKKLELEDFKKSFKVLHRVDHVQMKLVPGTLIEERSPTGHNDIVEVDIIAVDFVQKSEEARRMEQFDTVRVTLDPTYKRPSATIPNPDYDPDEADDPIDNPKTLPSGFTYLYINNGLGLTDYVNGESKTVFGNPQNWANGFFHLYEYENRF